jgi:peptidoglycan/xylan/chitin deacetylase (PgdA/CDA1 family)
MKFLRRSAFALSIAVLLVLSAWTIFAFTARDKYVVPILMYHRIVDSRNDLNAVSPESFTRQMAFLYDHGYQVLSLDDLVEGMHKARMFKRHVVALTFDDGYEDNYTNAFPILRKYAFPATVFMIADAVGKPDFLTAEQLKAMYDGGFKVGSHTRRHAYLPKIKDDPVVLEDEVINSKKILEKVLERPIDFFSYPSGGFSESVIEMVKKAGYKGACATNRGLDKFNLDVYQLNRIRVNNGDGDFVLWAKLTGYYNLFRKNKKPY